jgi:hypothetical protein
VECTVANGIVCTGSKVYLFINGLIQHVYPERIATYACVIVYTHSFNGHVLLYDRSPTGEISKKISFGAKRRSFLEGLPLRQLLEHALLSRPRRKTHVRVCVCVWRGGGIIKNIYILSKEKVLGDL